MFHAKGDMIPQQFISDELQPVTGVGRAERFGKYSVPLPSTYPGFKSKADPHLGSFRSFERRFTAAMMMEAGWAVQDHRSGNDRTFTRKSAQIVVGALDTPSPLVPSVDPHTRFDDHLWNRLGSRARNR